MAAARGVTSRDPGKEGLTLILYAGHSLIPTPRNSCVVVSPRFPFWHICLSFRRLFRTTGIKGEKSGAND